jgi:hypothetical protein
MVGERGLVLGSPHFVPLLFRLLLLLVDLLLSAVWPVEMARKDRARSECQVRCQDRDRIDSNHEYCNHGYQTRALLGEKKDSAGR